MRLKRIIAVFVAAAISLCGISGVAAEESSASAVLDAKAKVSGMKIRVGTDGTYKYSVVDKDGRSGWSISPNRGEESAIYVNLDKNVAYNIKDYSSYEVEVDYFDEGRGHFRIMYDAIAEPWAENSNKTKSTIAKTEVVELGDTGEWITHKFIIENPKFKGGYNNSDFAITVHEDAMGISPESVTFGEIRVNKAETKSTVRASLSTEAIGNNFFSTENVVINMDAFNVSDEDKKLNVSVEAYDYYGEAAYTDNFELSIEAKKSVSRKIEFKPEKYSIYTMYVKLSGEGVYSSSKIEYSYVYENEKDNMFMGVNNHMYRLMTRNPDNIIPLMDKIGVGWNREGIWWDYYETTKGVYALPERAEHTRALLNSHQIDSYMLLSCLRPVLYGGAYPVGDVYEAAFLEYVRNMALEFKGEITTWELFNELNQKVQEGLNEQWYGRLIRQSYKILKEIDPNNKLVIGTTSGVPLEWIKTVCIEAEGHFDGFSIHPYGMKVSPVDSERYSAILSAREVLDANGAEGIPLYISEMGWSTGWVDYETQAAYLAQIYAILTSPELEVGNVIYYDFHDDGFKPEDQENNFGMIRTWEVVDTPFLAKPSYITTSTINRFLTDAKYVDRKFEDNVSMYKYKAADGKDVLMLWSQNENDYKTIDIGSDNAEVYDMYGNKIDLFRKSGKYSMCLDKCPVYIIGDFDKFELSEPLFELSGTVYDLPYDDALEIIVTQTENIDARAELQVAENSAIEVINTTAFTDGKAIITIHSTGKPGLEETARLLVTGNEGEIYIDENILFKFTDMISVDFSTRLFSDNSLSRWIGVLKIKNHNHVKPIKGEAVFNGPESISKYIKKLNISEIAPDSESVIMFNMPEVKYFSSYYIDMDIVLDSGYNQNFSMYADCLAATYAETKPQIDAIASDGEWENTKPLKIGAGREAYITGSVIPDKYDGDDDLSAEAMFKWDEDNLYMFATIRDDVMCQENTGAVIWKGDSIQFGINYGGILDPTVQLFTEIGLAHTPKGPDIQRYSNETGASGVNKYATLATGREGKYTYYELMMPWNELIMDGVKLKAGDAIRFNMIVNDNDGLGRWGWIEYSYGIGSEKDGSSFGYMNLIDNRKTEN